QDPGHPVSPAQGLPRPAIGPVVLPYRPHPRSAAGAGRAGHPARPAAADAPAGAGAYRPGQGLRTSATGLPRRVLSAGTGLPRSSARRPASGGSGTLADPGAGAGDRPDP